MRPERQELEKGFVFAWACAEKQKKLHPIGYGIFASGKPVVRIGAKEQVPITHILSSDTKRKKPAGTSRAKEPARPQNTDQVSGPSGTVKSIDEAHS